MTVPQHPNNRPDYDPAGPRALADQGATTMNPNPSTTPGRTPIDVPGRVQALATQRQLGQLVDVRRERSMAAQIGIGFALAAGGATVSLLISAYNSAQTAAAYSGSGGGSHFFLPSGAVFLIGLGMVVRGLLVGTRAHYLFTGGLISTRRTGPRSVSWNEVTELRAVHGRDRSQVAGYRLARAAGPSTVVPLRTDRDGRDPFIDGLIDLARQHDLPIH